MMAIALLKVVMVMRLYEQDGDILGEADGGEGAGDVRIVTRKVDDGSSVGEDKNRVVFGVLEKIMVIIVLEMISALVKMMLMLLVIGNAHRLDVRDWVRVMAGFMLVIVLKRLMMW